MRTFSCPKILRGSGALEGLADEVRGKGNKAAIITGKTTAKFSDRVADVLKGAGYKTLAWPGSESDPSFEVIRKGSKEISDFQPQWVIGIGGGSVMDCTKGVWMLYERPDLSDADLMEPRFVLAKLNLRQKSKLILISTTSGTGSEVTWAAVFTDKATKRKMPVANRELVPDIAVLEPELTAGMSPQLTAGTAMDAIGHALDGYTCRWANDFSDGLCLEALKLAFEWLPVACKDGNDLNAREKMQNASALAGLGMGNSNTALSHTLAHPLGGILGMPHGRAVGLATHYSLKYMTDPSHPLRRNTEDPTVKIATLARFLGIDASSDKDAVKKFIQKMRDLAVEVGEPLTLKEAGITAEQMNKKTDILVHHASMDPTMIAVPRECELPNLRQLFQDMYSGK